jgi:hypothetical protein
MTYRAPRAILLMGSLCGLVGGEVAMRVPRPRTLE